MAIWIGDFMRDRKALDDDELVLYREEHGQRVFALRLDQGIGEVGVEWTGPLPPMHPDDIAADEVRRLEFADQQADQSADSTVTIPCIWCFGEDEFCDRCAGDGQLIVRASKFRDLINDRVEDGER